MTLRRTELRRISPRRLEKFGFMPRSTLDKPDGPRTVLLSRPRNTGPKRPVLEVVNERAGALCEFYECIARWADTHHRLNRKQGGRHGEMAERINGAEWLLKACRFHHRLVTSPVGAERKRVMDLGWLLLEHQDALRVPVLTRHDEEPIWLLPSGEWLRYEEACA